ncbi:MAG: hypothetical protein ACFFD4_05670 [Candidatus Odinarchaeota archaeon]
MENKNLVETFCTLVLGSIMHNYANKYFDLQTFVFDHRSSVFKRLDSLAGYK